MSNLTVSLKKIVKSYMPRRILILLQNSRNLTKIPLDNQASISDLFLYRCEDNWNTYFELLNVPGIIEPASQNMYSVHLIFFDENGKETFHKTLTNDGCKRNTINLKQLVLDNNLGLTGLFSCFHEKSIRSINAEGGFIAERGYTGYINTDISLTRAYVHGNFDALARYRNGKLHSLGGAFGNECEYRLQHELVGEADYELSFVNTTNSKQNYKITFIGLNKEIETTDLTIPSRGYRFYYKKMNPGDRGRIIITSKANLSRPVVFRKAPKYFDVFHG